MENDNPDTITPKRENDTTCKWTEQKIEGLFNSIALGSVTGAVISLLSGGTTKIPEKLEHHNHRFDHVAEILRHPVKALQATFSSGPK